MHWKSRIFTASDHDSLVVVEIGCNIGDIVRETMNVGLAVPLGGRPSIGSGLWLQGGIGHLGRLHGLTCDSIVGAVMVSVESGKVFCVGHVPNQYLVTFKAYTAPTYSVRNWIIPLVDRLEAQLTLSSFDKLVASTLPPNLSADAYLYRDNDKLHLGVTMFECSTSLLSVEALAPINTLLGPPDSFKIVDGVGLFDTEMYMSVLHGSRSGGKPSSFKRCLFLKHIGPTNIAEILLKAVETWPSPLCYLHLLQGGGAISDVPAHTTAFGCQDWDFACVVTVYDIARDLLPWSRGAYGADLGLEPRDAVLAVEAFGGNGRRLAALKHSLDPYNVLAYTCPLPKVVKQKLIILVTGDSFAGKDYCAEVWVAVFTAQNLTARAISISEATKREYALERGADLNRLLRDRAYKEQHRPELTRFFHDQLRQRPRLPEERDEAPLTIFSHLVPDHKILDVRVESSKIVVRRGYQDIDGNSSDSKSPSNSTALEYCPSLIFQNDTTGMEAATKFVQDYLFPYVHEDLQSLAHMLLGKAGISADKISIIIVAEFRAQRGRELLRQHGFGKVNIESLLVFGGA
ncbi:uncharacterized protein LY89DRAFT_771792 [Mollisia scopiformis]|uniref:Uncharacterized protein n=1 Tax=Mollisia scopiformis TaxID=149040 RepID=A0A194XLY0_MOLSC|nr:uncharacterized protein LY89DRAFT_771792 [Mollisia scopiformis]KUJ20772.1 hypothetical protein LY89DRAFT_771792 [Mollisia scopiformis]